MIWKVTSEEFDMKDAYIFENFNVMYVKFFSDEYILELSTV